MSRRERRESDSKRRESDSKRHRSRSEQESSPKRSRRDGKPKTERFHNNDIAEQRDISHKHRRRLQDASPLEGSSAPDSRVESARFVKESDRKRSEHHEGRKLLSGPSATEVPKSSSYVQRDERGRLDRSFGRGSDSEHGWWRHARERDDERIAKSRDMWRRDEKTRDKKDDTGEWSHDRFFEMEKDPPLPPPPPPPPSTRRRPAFQEKKVSVDPETTDKAAVESEKPIPSAHPLVRSERREDRGRDSHRVERRDRAVAGDRVPRRGEAWRDGFSSREWNSGGGWGSFRGRDRYDGRQEHRSSGVAVDKWKHDLFEEASKSSPRKTEEDQIAKIEALLASS